MLFRTFCGAYYIAFAVSNPPCMLNTAESRNTQGHVRVFLVIFARLSVLKLML